MIKYGNFNVVIDACVLYKAPVRDLLLRLAEAELYQPKWSKIIFEEVARNLIENRGITQKQADSLLDCMDSAFPESMIDGFQTYMNSLEVNDKDKHVLAAAIKSNSQVIVTDNIKDFPDEALKPYDIEAQTPDKFLQNLLDLSPITIIKCFKQQSKDLKKPPMTEQELLKKLEKQVPEFIIALRDELTKLDNTVTSLLDKSTTED